MIAIDTSSIVAFLSGQSGKDVEDVDLAFEQKQAVLPPVVLTELLSEAKLKIEVVDLLLQIPLLEIREGFWKRAGQNRAKILSKGFKARVADALIAQACLDNDVPLVTRDSDFRHFSNLCSLKLMLRA